MGGQTAGSAKLQLGWEVRVVSEDKTTLFPRHWLVVTKGYQIEKGMLILCFLIF